MFRALLVLLWKHSVVRRRRRLNTLIELVAPLCLFYLLYLKKDSLNLGHSSTENRMFLKTGTQRLDEESIASPDTILYLPDTYLVGLLMDDIGKKLNLKRLPYFNKLQSGYYPCVDEVLLEYFPTVMSSMDAILIFHNVETWPNKLNYTIRMKQDFHTEDYAPLKPEHGPQTIIIDEGYDTFMRIQWAVDSSFIEMQTGRDLVPRVSIEEFPFKKSSMVMNLTAAFVCSVAGPMCWLGLMLSFVFLTCRLLEERASGIQELIKIAGVTMTTINLSHFLNVLPVGLFFCVGVAILLKTSSTPMLPNTDGCLIVLMLLLYFITVVAMAFVCSYIITSVDYVSTLAVVLYGLLWMPVMMLEDQQLPQVLNCMTGMLPHMPMKWFWSEVGATELKDSGVTSSNMFESTNGMCSSVFICYVFLVLQAVLWYTMASYLSLVRPGKYGQALPWYFIFQKKKAPSKDVLASLSSSQVVRDEKYFEPPPDDLVPGISIEHVTKIYPKRVALKDVSLKIYQGEITVLLGHNGAGKTTLMSIITGMTNATTGKVFVHGLDTATQQKQVHKHIGLCPQHNICFSNLTLQEHIMFYTMLKLGSYSEALATSEELAARLGLRDKLTVKCDALSGGMKRRTQFACALAGNADVLVLDEPTTGLDIETRRELWDLLLSLRGKHTVLISTHFMEEADALGDRVAALYAGELRCFATKMYLKKAIGSGYRLTLTTLGVPKEAIITNKVINYVPEAVVKEITYSSVSYNLPATANDMLPKLFTALEKNKSHLYLNSIGIGVSTLEEVFLKLCSNVDTAITETEVERATPDPTKQKYTGIILYSRQFIVLLQRQFRFIYYHLWVFLALQVFLPLIVIFMTSRLTNNKLFDIEMVEPRSMDLDMYRDRPDTRILFKDINNNYTFRTINNEYPGVDFRKTDNIEMAIKQISNNELEYNKYLAGLEINGTYAKILYTSRVRHAAPVALNMLSNLLAMQPNMGEAERIHTYNHPIGVCKHTSNTNKKPKQLQIALMWAIFVVFFLQTTHLNCVTLPCNERETGTRHIHIMSGCSPELHWITTFFFHLSISFGTLILPTAIFAYLLDQDATFTKDFVVAFAVLLTIGCMPLLAFMYLVSFAFATRTANVILFGYLFIFSVLFPILKAIDDLQNSKVMSNMYLLEGICWYIAPPYVLMTSVFQYIYVADANAWCEVLRDYCPGLIIDTVGWSSESAQICCAGENPRCYFCLDDFSPYSGIFILLLQFIVLMSMVFLSERGVFNGVKDRVKNEKYKVLRQKNLEENVLAEEMYVKNEIIKNVTRIVNDSLLVNDVHKRYVKLSGKTFDAVRGISFSVKKGECFGLLGVNGAGKSSTFKMLTADECTTRGQIFGNGYHLKRDNAKYLRTLGYCPQFFGLDMFQTGQQNLELVLTLRGLNRTEVKETVDAWIRIVGLEKYAKITVDSYSGGCARRLGAAAALCSNSPLTLLDEPSAGVDVAARRRLWTALRKALKQSRSIVITSHSLDEMETLCSRIAIMRDGRIRALGTPAGLKAAYSSGHAVIFKLKHFKMADGNKSEFDKLNSKILTKFNCTLIDQHMTMLHYHVNETMAYSELFTILEELKCRFPHLIEDYSVTETTLEEVFLSFAKKKKQDV